MRIKAKADKLFGPAARSYHIQMSFLRMASQWHRLDEVKPFPLLGMRRHFGIDIEKHVGARVPRRPIRK